MGYSYNNLIIERRECNYHQVFSFLQRLGSSESWCLKSLFIHELHAIPYNTHDRTCLDIF